MRLLRATEEQKRERDLVTYAAWGMRLTVAQYAAREIRLRSHPWTRQVMDTWLWVGEGGEVLSSCETLRMEALWRRGGEVRPVTAYTVASVFTEERLRGRRYASAMLERLHGQLAAEDSAAKAVVLYSDVDAAIYERAGYSAPRAVFDWVFSAEPGRAGEGVDALIGEREVAAALARVPRPEVPFLIWPSAGQVDWHLERERLYAEFLGRPRPEAAGARVGNSTALWAMTGRGKLEVLVFHAEGPREASALLRAARRAGAQGGAEKVHLWEPALPFAWLRPEDGGTRIPRDGSLPMIHPLDPALRPEDWQGLTRSSWG